ncbi:hypothetical protein DICPUDRAFT_74722 [Dictyostelium purpureum]|uniref:Alpha-1,2-Mannosidase n=1 Tax=Dictyostelium purpureum TaxID=5786 RepID=F0Z8J9_DICPU|nr:uncharacterized protein DICPUDRAFT_74722 [Dictyostelium purpureum]EGC39737.1 hypothetical protein DICPUDRAFT_74722 [Dictyostelium purpureum]|eukprot:XP_003283723.1 hypothetical protein DICPUDRAFT_74722 [Dictyostelium purpureum]
MYDLTDEQVYLNKAVEFGDLLMYAFSDKYPFPARFINTVGRDTGDIIICISLAPLGTFSLEFARLSDLTGDNKYIKKINIAIDTLNQMKTTYDGLFPCSISRDAKRFCSSLISIGRQGDSYYEYLLKMWIYTDGEEEKYSRYFETSADLIIEHLYRDNVLLVNEDHLTCFVDGMFALAAAVNITGNDQKNEIYMEVGREE